MEREGKLVVFEGGPGSGKTTQAGLLQEKELGGWKFYHEPGGTAFGDAMREAVQMHPGWPIHPVASLLAYCASRANLVRLVIEPLLKEGENVALDRYWYSSWAYQGAEGVLKQVIWQISDLATGGLTPNLVIHYDVKPEIGMERKADGKDVDRYDMAELAFHRRVRKNYKQLMRLYPRIWRTIDASGSIEEVYQATLEVLLEFNLI